MPVGAHNDEVSTAVGCMRQDCTLHPNIAGCETLDLSFNAVAGEMPFHVGAGNLATLVSFAGDDNNLDCLCAPQDGYRIADRACCGTASVPADHHPVGYRWLRLDARHDDDRAS